MEQQFRGTMAIGNGRIVFASAERRTWPIARSRSTATRRCVQSLPVLCDNGRAPAYLSEHCIPVSSADTRRHLRSANVIYLPYRVSGSTLTTVGRSQLLARWPGTLSRILSAIHRAAQTVLGVNLKRTCSRVKLLVHRVH